MVPLYYQTDLTYEYCLEVFAYVQAAKRENFGKETMKVWFIEFIRRGWTKKMLTERYNALLSKEIYGVEKLEIADWINSVQVYAIDEVNLLVNRKVEGMIQRGNLLKGKNIVLTEEDKKCVELAIAREIEFEKRQEKFRLLDDYKEQRKNLLRKKFKAA